MEAFNILFNQYSNQAIRTVYLIIGRNDMAEDIVQEAFIKCYKEIKKLVNEAVDKLSVPLKTTIILYYYNELSIKEISKILGCFQGTVKSRLHNARKLLAKELRSEKFEGYSFYNSLNGKEQDENVKPTTI